MATVKIGDRKGALDPAEQFCNGPERLSKATSNDLEARGKDPLLTVEKDIEKRLEPLLMQLLGGVAGLRDVVQNLARRVHHIEQQMEQREHRVMPGAPKGSSLPPDVVAASSGD